MTMRLKDSEESLTVSFMAEVNILNAVLFASTKKQIRRSVRASQ